ncbi:nucleotidyltransferase family protein [Arthrobacter sp. AQ5-05]|nr:nucleotidyltransferase family protein [Arthrobacter sp. AQ5-05]
MTNPIQRPSVLGVLLAAGSGSRLGLGPKALLRKAGGQTLLESARHALLDGGCGHVVVLGAEARRVAAELNGQGDTTVLVNERWATGMGSSLALGLAAVPEGSAALLTLVDQPGLSAELVHRILQTHRPGRITAAGFRRDGAPIKAKMTMTMPLSSTRPMASGQVTSPMTETARNELMPSPAASPKGRFATMPKTMVISPAARPVAAPTAAAGRKFPATSTGAASALNPPRISGLSTTM